jgi:Rod binding domain-containing protein
MVLYRWQMVLLSTFELRACYLSAKAKQVASLFKTCMIKQPRAAHKFDNVEFPYNEFLSSPTLSSTVNIEF